MNRSALDEMNQQAEPAADDQDILYDLLDRALARMEEGLAVDIDDLLSGHERLRDRALEMIRLATRVGTGPGNEPPAVPGYTILGELGQGGMGTVFLARQERIGGRLVALKVLPHASGLSHRARRRFSGEALAIGRLRHPNVVAIHDVIDDLDVQAYAMEWVDGQSLAQLIRNLGVKNQQADIGYICRLGIAIARALAAVHRAGLIHRDVKPSNILIRPDGTPLLSDFGLVREADSTMTQPGHFAGTVSYAAPEQLRGEQNSIDVRSDVYSLGATLFHALALRLPYEATEPLTMLAEIERGPPMSLRRFNSRIPRDLETIISKAMEGDPLRRYQTADELAEDLERLVAFQPIQARRANVFTRTARLVRRHRGTAWGAIAGSILSLGLAAAVVVYIFLVPAWVDQHVAEARLSLLDPGSSEAISVSASALFGNPADGSRGPAFVSPEALTQAKSHYDAALRWHPFDKSIQRERDDLEWVSRRIHTSSPADPSVESVHDLRSKGLRAFLIGDVTTAMAAWEEYETQTYTMNQSDPLVDGAMGILYLVRDEPQRAYPRLRDAVHAFPDVGFLTVDLADAALQCGDLAQAQKLLRHARSQDRLDLNVGLERVEADLLVALGRPDEAIPVYTRIADRNPVAQFHLARLLETQGRLAPAVEAYQRLVRRVKLGLRPTRALVSAADRWWASLSPDERIQRIRAILDTSPYQRGSLGELLQCYRTSLRTIPSDGNPGRHRTTPIARCDLKPLASLTLPELVARLQIADSAVWDALPSSPVISKKFRFASWRWPILRPFAAIVDYLCASACRRSMNRGAAAPPCSQPTLQPPAGLIAWWPGDGDPRDIWRGGEGHVLNRAQFAGGKVGQAFDFASDDEAAVVIPNSGALFPRQFTIDAWIMRMHDFRSDVLAAAIVTCGSIELAIHRNRGGLIVLTFRIAGSLNGGFNEVSTTGTTPIPLNEFHHVAATFDGASLKTYLDGRLESQFIASSGFSPPQTSDVLFSIGANEAFYHTTFPGRIDEVQLFDRPLSEAEIRAIYAAGSAGQCKTLGRPQ